jgi:glucuronokinase
MGSRSTEGYAYARAGLLGNPSDGYNGKVIAISLKNFSARVILEESEDLWIIGSRQDEERYRSMREFSEKISLHGYYGGVRLIKAALLKFFLYASEKGRSLGKRNFSVRYESDIPRQVGLGGSSAIITATLRALMKFFEIHIPLELQPSLILSAERDELGINAGFMDRVAQVYEGCVYMDLSPEIIEAKGYGNYERLDAGFLPDLYLAYNPRLGKISGLVLSEIRQKFSSGDAYTISTLRKIAELAEEGKAAIVRHDREALGRLMNENFDLRRSIMAIDTGSLAMVETARRCGASAKFAGSGGSITGIYEGAEMFERLRFELDKLGATVIRPAIA